MNDRILGALKAVGITDAPLASLDHEHQFFALTPQLLLFQGQHPSGPLQQVTLRDISRIHSDHQGTLRVETSAGTSITASLLGFDPNRVQRFFQTVRDATARAKQQPSSPLPSAGSKMFAPSTPTAAPSASPVASTPTMTNTAATDPTPRPAELIVLGDSQEERKDTPAAPTGGSKVVKIGDSPTPSAPPIQPPSSTIRIEARPPVNVSASSTLNTLGPDSKVSVEKPPAPTPSAPPKVAVSEPSKAAAPDMPVPSSSPTVPMSDRAAEQINGLARAARALGAQRWTLRILALVLVLGALGMGFVMWQQDKNSQLPALWTVTIGVVTAVALLIMAELLKVLSLLGQVVSEQNAGPDSD